MINEKERTHVTTYDQTILPSAEGVRSLYAGFFKKALEQNSSVIVYYANDILDNRTGAATVFDVYHQPLFRMSPLEDTPHRKIYPKLSLKQAQEIALKALVNAEQRRQSEREAEAKYWSELD
jgi:hypothetical protein